MNVVLAVSLFATIPFLGLACDDDGFPDTPSEPFNHTRVEITNDTSPRIGSTLTSGEVVRFDIGIAYTLSDDEIEFRGNAANNALVRLRIDFQAIDVNANIIDIDLTPSSPSPIDREITILDVRNAIKSATRSELFSVIIPINIVRVRLVVRIFDQFSGRNLASDIKNWSVQSIGGVGGNNDI